MPVLSRLVETNPEHAVATFNNVEAALNEVLPGSDYHSRYTDAEEVALAVVVGSLRQIHFNPVFEPNDPSFLATNQAKRPDAWGPIPEEYLGEGVETTFGRFAFFAMAKLEHLRRTGFISSYDPDQLSINPGEVGFAGALRGYASFTSTSGLWEVHDHLVAGTFAEEIVATLRSGQEPKSSDRLAERFERDFDIIQTLHYGVAAADIPRKWLGNLLPVEHIGALRPLILPVADED